MSLFEFIASCQSLSSVHKGAEYDEAITVFCQFSRP